MAQTGARVVLVDADLGGANQHTLLGIDKPGHTLQGLFERTIQSLEEAIVPTVEPRLGLIPGSGAVVGAANIGFQQKQKLIRHIRALDADVVVIDVGAGVSFNVLDLFDAADLRLVVMTSQLTSLQNAYAFIKGAVFREIRRLADNPERLKLVEESPEACVANRRIPEMLARLHHSDPSFEKAIQNSLLHFGGRIIGNNLGNSSEQAALQAISRMTNDFLGVDAPVLGFLMASQTINNSVSMRKPFLLQPDGVERSAATLRGIARILLTTDISALRRDFVQSSARKQYSFRFCKYR
jgi:flagellar biosynthesis protein FlhG